MANATVSDIGRANNTGTADALFLKVFAGEVMAQFEKDTVFKDRTMSRSISSGKSATFPVVGRNSAAYHTPGNEIVGAAVAHNERVITIDDLLVSSVFIASIEEAKNHYDVRGIYSQEVGRALANAMDQNLGQVGVLAARATTTITGESGGTALTNAAYSTNSTTLASGIFSAAQTLDEKFVPSAERSCYLRPAQYYLLAQNTTVINQWYGGQGAISDGTVLKVGGIEVVKSNKVPSTNVTTGVTAYQGNFSTTVGLVMHKSAIGTVKLMDLAVESAYDIRRQGTLIVAKYAMGHGILRPESAVELKTA